MEDIKNDITDAETEFENKLFATRDSELIASYLKLKTKMFDSLERISLLLDKL